MTAKAANFYEKLSRQEANLRRYGVTRLGICDSLDCNAERLTMLVRLQPEMLNFENYMNVVWLIEEALRCDVDLFVHQPGWPVPDAAQFSRMEYMYINSGLPA